MTIKQNILDLLTANSHFSSQLVVPTQKFSYSSGWVVTPSGSKKGHKLTIDGHKLEKSDALHSVLLNCLQNKKKIVCFQSKRKLNFGDAFTFLGDESSYWTIFPHADYAEYLAEQNKEVIERQKWKDLSEKFTPQFQEEWEERGFTYEQNKSGTQEWLDKTYPKESEFFNISGRSLEGELDLSDFTSLKKLYCSDNKLTNLILPNSLEDLQCNNNPLAGSLDDFLTNLERLKFLDISDTDFQEVNIGKLPRSLKEIKYSTKKRPECKLTTIVSLLETIRWGWCKQCQKPNFSSMWCQSCAEQEWKQLKGQELIEKFIEKQPTRYGQKIKWIPHEQFTNVEYLAEGGFSKIYKTKWKEKRKWYGESDYVVLKSLNNSQNINLDFLTEIANTKLVDSVRKSISSVHGSINGGIVECYGISQDPETKNYVMVMNYIEDGNLREFLKNKYSELSLKDKFDKLLVIISGLQEIHEKSLIHRDFHSGNILNDKINSYITDLGLSKLVNSQSKEGQIFGVLPYVAPEVLRGQPYTQASDIYSFGIVAYELLTNAYPYPAMEDVALALRVCDKEKPLRPNLDKIPLPQELKDLIKRCWDTDPEKRPNVFELCEITRGLSDELDELFGEHQAIKQEYNTFSQNTPYQIHPTANLTSKMIDTKQITKLLQTKQYQHSANLDLDINDFNLDELTIQENPQEQSSTQAQIQIPPK